MGRTLLLAAALAGCVQSSSVDCGGGVICAAAQVCVHVSETVTACADPSLRTPCEDLPDGETCDQKMGRCYDGVCLPIVCGDNIVDPTERCDDGDAVAGDGCSSDCQSIEVCGNGVVDLIHAEVCDDDNELAHDGCAECRLETPRWTEIHPVFPPGGVLVTTPLAYHPSTGRVVMFAASSDETLVWDGAGWKRAPVTSPLPRTGHSLVTDWKRDRVVLVGGFGGFADTWEWDGAAWSLTSLNDGPPGLTAAAYDPTRGRIVAFGGRLDVSAANPEFGTWIRTGTTWSSAPLTVSESPPARSGAALAYDPIHDELVLFGGRDANKVVADTWTLRGLTWERRTVTLPPPARQFAALYWDGTGLVLYGGVNDAATALGDAWRWDGTNWTALPLQAPGPRATPGVAVDTERHRVVLYGGAPNSTTWELGDEGWRPFRPFLYNALVYASVVVDPLRSRSLVVIADKTFAAVDGAYDEIAGGPSGLTGMMGMPPPPTGLAFAYDTARDRAVAFGGTDGGANELDTTYVFDPQMNKWSALAVVTTPPARSNAMMAFDTARGITVLFGGYTNAEALADTWELDTDWHRRSPVVSPPGRTSTALAYDPIRRVTLVFGGYTHDGTALADTWEWNGASWTEVGTVGPRPPARALGSLTWNPARRRLTLFGGVSQIIGQLGDTWEWTGTAWEEVKTPTTPPRRAGHVGYPASDGSGLYVFSGLGQGTFGDTWFLTWSTDGRRYERCADGLDLDGDTHAACADPDCWASCTPLCPPGLSCAAGPTCGDHVADEFEGCQVCPVDVTGCVRCGDFACEAPESHASCPGDCP